ncbi:MAG: class I SAM-dependent methyltransferase [Chloroflexota bacterium]|nr:class I SAM-dependent methyltransferase [Chloroflexota bacterium]
MKQRLAHFLGQWPALYRLASRVYWTLQFQHLAELVVGTRARERRWAARPIAEGYWENRDLPSKHFLADRIAAFAPVNSILEVGCASGTNLYLLAGKFPQAQIVGVDINVEAVNYGNARFAQEGMENVSLRVGKADGLGQFGDRSFDVVFTNALLIYIGPDKIREVVGGMLRLAKRVIVLMELHRFESKGRPREALGIYQYGNWTRDYAALWKQFVKPEQVRVSRIPEVVWPARPWSESGAVIEVVLDK